MKKLISIPLLVMILFCGININIASHYCGGRLAATKVSLSGKAATCGMEEHAVSNTPNGLITRHCCDNVISSLTMGINYVPSASLSVKDDGPVSNQHYIAPDDFHTGREKIFSYSICIRRPPGQFNPSDVEQPSICIFRI